VDGKNVISHYDSNSHHLWEAKMQNQYVKHETFLMQIDDLLKSIQGQQNCLN
jgi:hypothetical protein